MRETFHVSPEEKQMLLESLAQADRGEVEDMDDLLAELAEEHEDSERREESP
jgi:hypothetical protein